MVLPLRSSHDALYQDVQSEIRQKNGPAIPVSYRLSRKTGSWKVYDINIDGISLVLNYRSTFSSTIRHEGTDGLISKLADKNQRIKF